MADLVAEVVQGIVTDRADMAFVLSRAMAPAVDVGLREAIRLDVGVPRDEAFALHLPPADAWLTLGPRDAFRVDRERPTGVPVLEGGAVDGGSTLGEAWDRSAASGLVTAEARRLLHPMFQRAPLTSRERFDAVRGWGPVLDQLAFKAAARLSTLVDALRPTLKTELAAGLRESHSMTLYWESVHAMARLHLLAADEGARPWLADMAGSFTWTTWTPTFVLLRERTAWLAAAAARSAMAFGEAVVEGYLRVLSASESPMRTFDALFGLTAIALANPGSAAQILTATRAAAARHGSAARHHEVVELSLAHATHLITGAALGRSHPPEAPPSALKWGRGTPSGLGTRPALSFDPTVVSEPGRMTGLSMLPFVISTRLEEHFPSARALRLLSSPNARSSAAVLERTWMPQEPYPEGGTH